MNARYIAALIAVLLFAPGGSGKALAQDWIYLASPGDTLWDLCLKYTNKRGCWIELGKYNNIVNDRRIPPGSEIRFPLSWLRETPDVGKVDSVQGEVFYFSDSSAAQSALVAGQPLLLGSRIVTGDGTARISLGNHSSLLVRPGSELRLDSLSTGWEPGQSTELSLQQGDVEVSVEPESRSRFQVKTPSAIAAVRGTRYRVSQQQSGTAATRSEVLAGLVDVQAGESLLLPAGFGVLAQQGMPLGEPRKLLAPPVFEQPRIDSPLPISIQWRNDPKAVAWRLDVVTADAKMALLASYKLTEPRMEFDELEEACYQLVLRGIDAQGFNGMESRLPVCVVSLLPAPAQVTLSGAGTADKPYSVAWAPVSGASSYQLEIATDPGFENVIASQAAVTNQASVSAGAAPTVYVRVTAIDENNNTGIPSPTVRHLQPNYIVPSVMTALILALALL